MVVGWGVNRDCGCARTKTCAESYLAHQISDNAIPRSSWSGGCRRHAGSDFTLATATNGSGVRSVSHRKAELHNKQEGGKARGSIRIRLTAFSFDLRFPEPFASRPRVLFIHTLCFERFTARPGEHCKSLKLKPRGIPWSVGRSQLM